VPWSTLRAESAKNKFAFAKNPFPERTRGGLRHLVPLYVLNIAASITDEVVMPHAFHIEPRGAAFHSHFAH
jgi:hypothetical protein